MAPGIDIASGLRVLACNTCNTHAASICTSTGGLCVARMVAWKITLSAGHTLRSMLSCIGIASCASGICTLCCTFPSANSCRKPGHTSCTYCLCPRCKTNGFGTTRHEPECMSAPSIPLQLSSAAVQQHAPPKARCTPAHGCQRLGTFVIHPPHLCPVVPWLALQPLVPESMPEWPSHSRPHDGLHTSESGEETDHG